MEREKKNHPSSKCRNLVQCVFAPWCWGVLPSTKLVVRTCRYLVHCLQADLNNYMPAFLDDPEEHNPQRPKIGKSTHACHSFFFLLLQHFEKDLLACYLRRCWQFYFHVCDFWNFFFSALSLVRWEFDLANVLLGQNTGAAVGWGASRDQGWGTIPNFLTRCQFQYFGFDTDSRVMLFYRNRCFKTSFSKNNNTSPLHAVHKTFILRFYWGFESGFPPDEVVFFKTSLKQMLLGLLWHDTHCLLLT